MMLITKEELKELYEVINEKIDEELNGNPEGLSLFDLVEQDMDANDELRAVMNLVRAFTAPITHENVSELCTSIENFVVWYDTQTKVDEVE